MKSNSLFFILSLLFFGINAGFHLFYKERKNLTKALLIPSIVLCYISLTQKPSLLLVFALFASWLGDILLTKDGMKWFVSGGISFIVSHILLIFSYIPSITFEAIKWYTILPSIIIYCFICCFTVSKVGKRAPAGLFFPLLLYLLFNAGMNLFAWMLLLSHMQIGTIMLYSGAVLFFISDNCLFFHCFGKNGKNLFLPLMSTYIAGEFLIAVGSSLF